MFREFRFRVEGFYEILVPKPISLASRLSINVLPRDSEGILSRSQDVVLVFGWRIYCPGFMKA